MHIHRHAFFNLERETNQWDGASADNPGGSDPVAAVIPVADAWAGVDPVADAWQPLVGGGGDPGEATTRSYLVSFAGWSKGNIAEREVDTPETPDSSDPVPVWALRFVQISSGNHADAYIL
jgi:hypothetical protein